MKIEIVSERKMILFFMTKTDFSFDHIKELQEELKEIFVKLKYQYKMDMEGFYHVKVYRDEKAFLVFELEKEDEFDSFYLDGEVDMRIEVLEETFFYQINDIFDLPSTLRSKVELYLKEGTFYVKPKEKLTFMEIGFLLEQGTLFYHNHNPYFFKEKEKIEY